MTRLSTNHGLRVLGWLVILVDCKIKGINELQAREPKNSLVYAHYNSRGLH